MATAVFVQEGDVIDYTPSSAVAAGDVVVQGDLIGVAKQPIAANTAERARIEKQIKAADAALEAAEQKHTDTTAPLYDRLKQVKDDTWAGEQATGQLHATCDDPKLLEQLADVQTRMADARHDAHRLRTLVDDWRARVRNEAALVDRAKCIVGGSDEVEQHQVLMKEAEKRLAMCQAELAKVEKAIADLERQEAAVHENMLTP